MSTADVILAALAEAPMSPEALAHECDLSRRSVGQGLRALLNRGAVEQDDLGRWRLSTSAAPAEAPTAWPPAVVAAPPPTADVTPDDAPPIASFAIWDDGSITISRDSDAMYLSPDEVARLNAHMARFR